MAANRNKIEYEFIESEENWNLKKLYIDLASAKKKALTSVEKTLLRGLLCGYSPAEIAHVLYQSRSSNTVRVYLSNGLYKYIEQALSEQTGNTVKIQNWSRVTQLLEKAGYRKNLLQQSQLSHSLTGSNQQETNSIAGSQQHQPGKDEWEFFGRQHKEMETESLISPTGVKEELHSHIPLRTQD